MATSEDREHELKRKELEIQAREQEIRLRELETQIYQQHQQERKISSYEPALYETKKHQSSGNSLKKLGEKLVKFGKFTAFVIIGVAFVRVGFWVGMWLTYLTITGIIAFIGYQIYLNDDNH